MIHINVSEINKEEQKAGGEETDNRPFCNKKEEEVDKEHESTKGHLRVSAYFYQRRADLAAVQL